MSDNTAERLREVIIDLERSKGRVDELREEANGLLDAMNALMGSGDESEVLSNLMFALKKHIGFDEGLILFYNENGFECLYTTYAPFKGTLWSLDGTLQKLEKKEPVCLFDIRKVKEEIIPDIALEKVVSVLNIPLRGRQESAVLMCTHPERGHFSKKDLRLATKFIPFATQGIILLEHQRGLKEEITRREKSEKKLRELQNEMIANAYREGFAENAINVLHMVGNLLTPTKVIVELMGENEDVSDVLVVLGKLRSFIEGKERKEFVKEDILNFIEIVSSQLQNYEDEKKKSLIIQQDKLGQIEKIITEQKKYLDLRDESAVSNLLLLDTFYNIEQKMMPALVEERIKFSKEIDKGIIQPVGKEGFNYIIWDIIENSIDAHREKVRREEKEYDKYIQVKAFRNDGEVKITIEDNGIGLSTEDHSTLFLMGTTSKKSGKGFGLHSVANFIQGNGGKVQLIGLGEGIGCRVEMTFPDKGKNTD